MAHKKAGGSSRNGRDSNPKMLGVKLYGGQKVAGGVGSTLTIGEVLMLGGDTPTHGAPLISGASVACEILAQGKGEKVIAFKKKRRKNTHRKRGHRQPFTKVKVTAISAA